MSRAHSSHTSATKSSRNAEPEIIYTKPSRSSAGSSVISSATKATKASGSKSVASKFPPLDNNFEPLDEDLDTLVDSMSSVSGLGRESRAPSKASDKARSSAASVTPSKAARSSAGTVVPAKSTVSRQSGTPSQAKQSEQEPEEENMDGIDVEELGEADVPATAQAPKKKFKMRRKKISGSPAFQLKENGPWLSIKETAKVLRERQVKKHPNRKAPSVGSFERLLYFTT